MRPLVVGMGRLGLDVVWRAGEPLRAQAGGTCGNVLAILAWLGWRALPVARVGDDDAGARIVGDLERFGVDCSLVERVGGAESPVVVHEINESSHSFSLQCPLCGRTLPDVEPPRLPPPLEKCRAFVFDQDSETALRSARRCRETGTLVVYEPGYAGAEVAWEEALAVADVLKCSRSQLPGAAERAAGTRLVIETDGERGLRWRLDGRWHDSPALRVAVTRDAGGAGDWTTAGFLDAFAGWEQEKIAAAVRRGQAMGAWACAFDGARGGMCAATPAEFKAEIGEILAGRLLDPGKGRNPRLGAAGRFCRCHRGGAPA